MSTPNFAAGMVPGFVQDGEVVCGQCYTRFVKTEDVIGSGPVMVLRFICWRSHRFGLKVEVVPSAENVLMEWVG